MVYRPSILLRRRFFCSKTLRQNHRQWPIKQVTKSNFNDSLLEIKDHISSSDFIAVSLQNTGSFSSPWHRLSAFDTPEIAYFKAKFAAERFQIIQFAICPFKIEACKLIAYPYNFHLFPRDELKIGMPSYSFTCQTSYLTSMAKEGFDFNSCIYDGISYLSRAQESAAKVRLGNPIVIDRVTKSDSAPAPTVADTVFVERIRSRVKHWKNACTESSRKTDEDLLRSLRKIVLGSELYGSRPCMTIDVCSERLVELVLKMLDDFSNDLVPLIIPAKSGGTQAVRVVLTSSEEDMDLLKRELLDLQVEQNKRVRGFREVIELISASQKPVVSHNSLNDFAFIHSKFLGPLPPNMGEFMCSTCLAFPQVLDVNHLMKDVGPARSSISTNMSYLKNRFFAPIDMEIPHQATENESKIHGHNVVKICHLFGKLCSILKITPSATASQSGDHHLASALHGYANIFSLCYSGLEEPIDEEIRVWTNQTRKVSCKDIVLLWGFRERTSAVMLKSLLQGSHDVFTGAFDVRLVDRSCAIVVFWQPSLSETFLDLMNSKEISGALREMVSEGLKSAGYETYKRVFSSGLWESELADAMDKALAFPDSISGADSKTKSSEVCWSSDLMINFDDL